MTAAHEATLFSEVGSDYALVCMVDNYANGIDPHQVLTVEKFHQLVAQNQTKVEEIVALVLQRYCESSIHANSVVTQNNTDSNEMPTSGKRQHQQPANDSSTNTNIGDQQIAKKLKTHK